MNEFQSKFLEHLVKLAHIDKVYAWDAAKRYAAMYPEELAELPSALTAAMLKLKAEREASALEKQIICWIDEAEK